MSCVFDFYQLFANLFIHCFSLSTKNSVWFYFFTFSSVCVCLCIINPTQNKSHNNNFHNHGIKIGHQILVDLNNKQISIIYPFFRVVNCLLFNPSFINIVIIRYVEKILRFKSLLFFSCIFGSSLLLLLKSNKTIDFLVSKHNFNLQVLYIYKFISIKHYDDFRMKSSLLFNNLTNTIISSRMSKLNGHYYYYWRNKHSQYWIIDSAIW